MKTTTTFRTIGYTSAYTFHMTCAFIQKECWDCSFLLYDNGIRSESSQNIVSKWRKLLLAQHAFENAEKAFDTLMREFRYVTSQSEFVGDSLLAAVTLNEDKYYQLKKKHRAVFEIKVNDDTLELLRTPISEMSLRTRTFNVLRAADCDIMYDVVMYKEDELMKLRCFGKSGIAELNDILKPYGLHLGTYLRFDEESLEYRTFE